VLTITDIACGGLGKDLGYYSSLGIVSAGTIECPLVGVSSNSGKLSYTL